MQRFFKAAVATASGVALTFSVALATELPARAIGYHGSVTTQAVTSVQPVHDLSSTGTVTLVHAARMTTQSGDAVVTAKKVAASKRTAAKATKHIVAKGAVSVASSRGSRALAFARRQLGDPYRFGATGPNSWDCSGLTRGAWRAAGVGLPHNARAQFHRGRAISRSQLQPGDLVFFYSGIKHVAIYAGGGNVIHAPRPGKRVQYIKMKYMPYKGARRPG